MRTFVKSACALALLVGASTPLLAQSVDDARKTEALRLIEAMNVTEPYRNAPFQDIATIEGIYVQNYPNYADRISGIVREEALNLADRYKAFQDEAALVYARAFSEEELSTLADFFETETGQKLLSEQQIMFREVNEAADIWRRGFRNDLDTAVRSRMTALAESEGGTAESPGGTGNEAAGGEESETGAGENAETPTE